MRHRRHWRPLVVATVRPLTFTVPGVAQPGGSKTQGTSKSGRRFVRDSNRNVYAWRERVAHYAAEAMNGHELLTGPLRLSVTFTIVRPKGHYGTGANAGTVRPGAPEYPTTRPDTTKLLRAVEDAMRGVVYRDDAQVVEQEAYKVYGGQARCEVTVGHPFGWGTLP